MSYVCNSCKRIEFPQRSDFLPDPCASGLLGSMVRALPHVLPVLDQVAQENPDTIKVAKINVDEEPELAGQFGVMSIPTVVLVKQGQVVSQSVGALNKHQVEAMIR